MTVLLLCVQFKRLIGRKYADPEVQEELRTAVFAHEALSDGGIGIKVWAEWRLFPRVILLSFIWFGWRLNKCNGAHTGS